LIRKSCQFLKEINPQFSRTWIVNSWIFKTTYAQPVVSSNYSKEVLEFSTPVENLFVTDMKQIYPWDRGTNYAIEKGEQLTKLILKS
jgi:hypothetical protein